MTKVDCSTMIGFSEGGAEASEPQAEGWKGAS